MSKRNSVGVVGVVGLGLIGGSVAKAYKLSGWRVLGLDSDKITQQLAVMAGDLDEGLNDNNIQTCEVLIIALFPQASVDFLKQKAPIIASTTLVMDFCGTKRMICDAGFTAAEEYGFTYVGAHPMAGKHRSGYKYSSEDLFVDASMIVVPARYDDIQLLQRVKDALEPLGLRGLSVTTAEKHDELIAFTSQLAHVVSNAYIKSPTAPHHSGFSAGSYKDLTRVACLNEVMWTELFFENKTNLLNELDSLIGSLKEYRDALATDNEDEMRKLLADGRKRKEEVDKYC